ncbi:MAG: 16S rRNA (uracil(1498)-N(3))-methyltransferase, partial [Acidobacteria bacterium]|nr:16S rRNA (uracil(1498)-N(3))-methyltransferase [Acidobacteriota bacterium]MCA1638387.1 16S rRNA (uracil(1498)-N(3))-methyltransferase [Acidobacteriota bacterium]
MRRFYASTENFDGQKITLAFEESRHLRDVLRLREGENVQIFDGKGKEFFCEIIKIEKKETVLRIIKKVSPTTPESDLDLTLAVALLKGEKFDLVVQKAVELGVTKFVPLNTKRADVKSKDNEKKLERWRKIIVDATKQSGRAKLMQIEPPINFNEFIKNSVSQSLDGENLLLFAERDGADFSTIKTSEKITAVIGSEGGWE